jgi:hypothetical protein
MRDDGRGPQRQGWFRDINRFMRMKRLTSRKSAGKLRPSIETG